MDIVRVRQGVWVPRSDGSNVFLKPGTYHKDALELQGLSAEIKDTYVEPFRPDFAAAPKAPDVEQATASPGEKRTTDHKPAHRTKKAS